MGAMFVKQPNGLLARFCPRRNDFTHWDMTEGEAVDVIEKERATAIERLRRAVSGRTLVFWSDCVTDALAARGSDDPELAQVIAAANRAITPVDTRQLTLPEQD